MAVKLIQADGTQGKTHNQFDKLILSPQTQANIILPP